MQRAYKIGVRLIIALAAYSFIALKIGWVGLLNIFTNLSISLSSQNLFWFGFAIMLMPLVWALEAYKWRFALSEYVSISFWKSWRSVWYGVVAGQLTPNRIGEPIGRLALIDSEVRGKAGFVAVWCSFTQQVATILFGLFSIFWWLVVNDYAVLPSGVPLWFVFFTILCWVSLMIMGIVKVHWIAQWFEKFGWVKRILHGEKLIIDFSASTFFIVQIISILRYIVFSTQYVILLKLFGVSASLADLYAVVGLTYLFSSFIPTFSASEVGVKAGFAIWFASMISDNAVGVTAASLFLWVLNLAIPALIAAWFPWRK
ncbi:MAG: hypothetical protein EHM93_02235 [Bacteroidales bacterium]|nr:MAG: hypothetical protein EHM93_02235 [Bacteroidales bacterium]